MNKREGIKKGKEGKKNKAKEQDGGNIGYGTSEEKSCHPEDVMS